MRAMIALAALLTATPVAAQRVEAPIRAVVLSDGTRRYAVTLQIAGRPVEVGVDTGSTGLRLLAKAVPADAARAGGEGRYGYGSGVEFTGPTMAVPIALGDLPLHPVRVQRIDRVGCRPNAQDCARDKVTRPDYGIQGDGLPGEGFAGIMGIGLRADPVANPLEQLGVRRWIVELPRPGEAGPGRLILNPDDAEVARYRQVLLIGDTNQVTAYIAAADGSAKVCGPAIVDSGANGLRVQGGTPAQLLPQGTPAVIAIGDARATVSMPVVIGRRDQAAGMRLYPARTPGIVTLSLGIAPYLRWSVLYGAAARRIGFADR